MTDVVTLKYGVRKLVRGGWCPVRIQDGRSWDVYSRPLERDAAVVMARCEAVRDSLKHEHKCVVTLFVGEVAK